MQETIMRNFVQATEYELYMHAKFYNFQFFTGGNNIPNDVTRRRRNPVARESGSGILQR
jgi:hypothetical protein